MATSTARSPAANSHYKPYKPHANPTVIVWSYARATSCNPVLIDPVCIMT